MVTVILINNNNGKKFEKQFPSPYLADKFKKKVKKGKSLTYVGEWYE